VLLDTNLTDDITNVTNITNDLIDISSSEAQSVISNYDILNPSFNDVCQGVLSSIRQAVNFPVELTLTLVVCILISGIMQAFSEVSKFSRVYSIVSVLVCIRLLVQPIMELVDQLKEVMLASAMYMDSYVPILSGIMVSTGQVSTSASYGAITYVCCQLWVQCANKLILPLVTLTLGIVCISGICKEIDLSALVKGIQQCVRWIMVVSMFVFSGVVTVQGAVGTSSDRVTSKAVKFVVSNGVPIVGSAVSDACETVRASLELLQSSVGLLGIVVVLVDVLPPVVSIAVMRAVVVLGETLADTLGVSEVKTLLSGVSSVLSVVLSCGVCFGVTFIVSIGAMALTFG
jgi:stage III sporulation protein AE